MIERNLLHVGSVVRLNSGSPKFTVERMDAAGVHLVGYSDRIGIIRLIAKPEVLCWPREREAPADLAGR